jgi:hypothetical protein
MEQTISPIKTFKGLGSILCGYVQCHTDHPRKQRPSELNVIIFFAFCSVLWEETCVLHFCCARCMCYVTCDFGVVVRQRFCWRGCYSLLAAEIAPEHALREALASARADMMTHKGRTTLLQQSLRCSRQTFSSASHTIYKAKYMHIMLRQRYFIESLSVVGHAHSHR